MTITCNTGYLKNQTFVHNKGKGINDNSSLFKKLFLNIDTGSTINIIPAATVKKLNVLVEEYNVVNVKQTKGILKLNQTCTFDLKAGSLVRSVRFFILNTDLPYALLGLESCIEFQLVIDCVKQVVVQKRRNLINFSSSEGSDLSLHINPENKIKGGIFEIEMKDDRTKECSIAEGKNGNFSEVKRKEKSLGHKKVQFQKKNRILLCFQNQKCTREKFAYAQRNRATLTLISSGFEARTPDY
ncbi:hypothetical protein TNCT_134401 [Trichonephila clavata]|uniref:Uncharacterized protein n=1 Tax=Trichonephila clavata TaxID=2740835 RepID=A0A8X6I072_TRICU|nr:hypothetical protein TNCT_134401 [Trichonephila clavata]